MCLDVFIVEGIYSATSAAQHLHDCHVVVLHLQYIVAHTLFESPTMTSSDSASPSPSPSPSSSSSRKRSRSETSSEERKEARAHRNRIAAQNSRDRRKAQFAFLERRVAELEEENRALRAARAVPLLPVSASSPHEEHEANARDRENEELKERIKTLERGWDAVLQALAVHGVTPSPQPPVTVPVSVEPTQPQESARHLARVASIGTEPMALQRADSAPSSSPARYTTPTTQPSKTSLGKFSHPFLHLRPRALLQRSTRGLPRKRPGASRRRLRFVLARRK